METTINSLILRLQGKAELPHAVGIGSNYHISLEGSVTNFTQSDNENGTHNRTYTFKPVKVELLDPLGETLQLKDARSKSQLLRARFFGIWRTQNINTPFEQWYDTLMDNLIADGATIAEMYAPKS